MKLKIQLQHPNAKSPTYGTEGAACFDLPEPDTHCFDADTEQDVWSYSKELVEQMLAERAAVLNMALEFLQRVRHWDEGKPDLHDMKQAIRKVLG